MRRYIELFVSFFKRENDFLIIWPEICLSIIDNFTLCFFLYKIDVRFYRVQKKSRQSKPKGRTLDFLMQRLYLKTFEADITNRPALELLPFCKMTVEIPLYTINLYQSFLIIFLSRRLLPYYPTNFHLYWIKK